MKALILPLTMAACAHVYASSTAPTHRCEWLATWAYAAAEAKLSGIPLGDSLEYAEGMPPAVSHVIVMVYANEQTMPKAWRSGVLLRCRMGEFDGEGV